MNLTTRTSSRLLLIVLLGAVHGCANDPSPTQSNEPASDPRGDFRDVIGLPVALDLDPDERVVEYALEISSTTQELLPGIFTEMWTYNGTSPGPLLRARLGDTMRIHVTNLLEEPTTVHWHGLRIDHRMDGVVHDGLLAIQPGETFTYEFVPPEAGTFWYHPHVRSLVQVEAGLYGMLVVQEHEADAPDVDADRVFVIDDIRLNAGGSIAATSTAGMDVMHGRLGNRLLVNGSAEVTPVTFARGQVERWRLVNTANARTFTFQFDGLRVREIGADGGLWPQRMTREIDELTLPVGARAELEVWLAEDVTSASLDAMVLVQDAAGNLSTEAWPLVPVEVDAETELETLRIGHHASPAFERISDGEAVTDSIALSAVNDALGFRFTVNGQSWPSVDTWSVRQNDLHVIELKNEIGPEHPFHLHGQFFQVLSLNGQPAWESGWRDTVLLPGMARVVIATRFENPGMWMYHCHILEHAEYGMMAMVEVVPDEANTSTAHGQ